MQITNSATVIQIEPVKKPVLSVIKKYVKWLFLPQWKKWKARNFISRIVEAKYMQEAEQGLSPDNLQQLRALERDVKQTRELSRHRFVKEMSVRTKQLCGYSLSEQDTNTAFNYAFERHFSALSRGVVPTEDDQSLSAVRREAITQVLKNTPAVKDCRADSEASTEVVQVVLDTTLEAIEVTQVTLDATPEVIEVVAETLPTETVVPNTTTLTDKQLTELLQAMAGKTSIGQLRLPHLKLYAKAHGFKIPGRSTRIKDIKNIVAAAQGSNKLLKI